MTRKIMIDMKLNGTRTTKIPNKEIPSKHVLIPTKKENTKPQEIPDIAPVTPSIKSFSEDESLRRASVFTSGWQAQTKIKVGDSSTNQSSTRTILKDSQKRLFQTPRAARSSKPIRKSFLFLFIIVFILGTGYWSAMFFERTTIVIQEKKQSISLDHVEFTAGKSPESPLHFEIMIVSDTDSKNIVLTESQDVSVSAHGIVTLFNEFTTKPQTISAHSFLADSSGKTYRTDKAVTIPGYKTNGTKIIPGQIDVSITAFLPGDSYNGNPTDFTISAFKGNTKFKKIYAKAKTPLTGGAQGLVYVLGSSDKGSLNATALSTLKSRLLKKVNAEVPKGYILYPNALSFTYNVDDDVQSPTPEAKIKIDSTLSAIILKENDMKDALIKNTLPNVLSPERQEIDIPDISKLSFSFIDPNQVINKDMQSVAFTLTGTPNAIWHPDLDSLKTTVAGLLKTELPNLFKTDPGIASARVTLFPPWQKHLPIDVSRIHIFVN